MIPSFYREIWGATTALFLWKGIWSEQVPKRESFFLWTVALREIHTLDNLTKRGLSLVNWCCMCYCNRVTVDQFLIHCDAAYALRGDVFQRFGVQWVMPGDIVSL